MNYCWGKFSIGDYSMEFQFKLYQFETYNLKQQVSDCFLGQEQIIPHCI